MRSKAEMEIMKDFDSDKYENSFCKKKKCYSCDGIDINGEPNGYGCPEREKRISIMYQSILKRRLKRTKINKE